MQRCRVLATLGMVLFVPVLDVQRVEHLGGGTGTPPELASPVAIVVGGIGCDAVGAPAGGAGVGSGAGGPAGTERNGRYRLGVGVPVDARCSWISAVGAGGTAVG